MKWNSLFVDLNAPSETGDLWFGVLLSSAMPISGQCFQCFLSTVDWHFRTIFLQRWEVGGIRCLSKKLRYRTDGNLTGFEAVEGMTFLNGIKLFRIDKKLLCFLSSCSIIWIVPKYLFIFIFLYNLCLCDAVAMMYLSGELWYSLW